MAMHVDVHKIRRAAHHAATRPGPVGHHGAPPLQVLDGARRDERQPDALARGGRRIGHGLAQGRIVLHIVQAGQRLYPVAEAGMGGDILDALALHVDLRALAQSGDVFGSCPGWHNGSPYSVYGISCQSNTGSWLELPGRGAFPVSCCTRLRPVAEMGVKRLMPSDPSKRSLRTRGRA